MFRNVLFCMKNLWLNRFDLNVKVHVAWTGRFEVWCQIYFDIKATFREAWHSVGNNRARLGKFLVSSQRDRARLMMIAQKCKWQWFIDQGWVSCRCAVKMFKLGGMVPSGKTTGRGCRETQWSGWYHRVPKKPKVRSRMSRLLEVWLWLIPTQR